MSVSLSDYTLGIAGQGWFVDEMLKENPDLYGSKLISREYYLTTPSKYVGSTKSGLIGPVKLLID